MAKGRIARMLSKANPASIVYHSREENEPRKLTLAEKVHLIHGAPKWKRGSDEKVMVHWRKLAGAMTQGVTNIMAPGISMAKVPGKALSQQVVNPNRTLKSSLNVTAPKAPSTPRT